MSNFGNVTFVAITGPHRSGKTTLAKFIGKYLEDRYQTVDFVSFGMFVKKDVSDCLNIGFDELEKIKGNKEVRALLQYYGDVRRYLQEDFFINRWKKYVLERVKGSDNALILVDDVYLVQEYLMLDSIHSEYKNVNFVSVIPTGDWDGGHHNKNKETKTIKERQQVENTIIDRAFSDEPRYENYFSVVNVFYKGDKERGLEELEERARRFADIANFRWVE